MKRHRTTEAGLTMLEEGRALVTKRIDVSTLEAVTGAVTEAKAQEPTQSDDPVHRLLAVLQKGELSSSQLRDALGIKHRPTFRQNYLHRALEAGFIEYTIPDKPNSRLQKYRLTPAGERVLSEQQTRNPS